MMTAAGEKTSYDEVAYFSHPYLQTHPDRLATLARLAGLTTPDVRQCRVLELGCAGGGNLIPMADQLPASSFLGIDLSSEQIAQGQEIVDDLELENVQLRADSILAVDDSWGTFDYIICHGVYSWVPNEVKAKILAICRDNLSANGVAYISYNTLPGWRMRGTLRDMMWWHTRRFETADERAGHSRALVNLLAEVLPDDNAFGLWVKSEAEMLQRYSDPYLIHEYLEEDNDPVYFRQFAAVAAERGLQYLGESNLHALRGDRLPPRVEGVFNQLADDEIEREQYEDFFFNRTFRQTLLCHDKVELPKEIRPAHLTDLYVSADLAAPTRIDDGSHAMAFTAPPGTVETRDVVLQQMLLKLHEAGGQAIRYAELSREVWQRLGCGAVRPPAELEAEEEHLGRLVLDCWTRDFLELNSHPLPITRKVGERPRASRLARRQAGQSPAITTARHRVVTLDQLARRILQLADGSKSKPQIIESIAHQVAAGELAIAAEPQTTGTDSVIAQAVDQGLRELASTDLLLRDDE